MAAPFGDPLLNAWILGWDADRLRHGLSGLWTAPPFYPYPDTLAYSEHLLGIAAPLAPIYWLTGNAVLLYNVALIGSFALAGIGMACWRATSPDAATPRCWPRWPSCGARTVRRTSRICRC